MIDNFFFSKNLNEIGDASIQPYSFTSNVNDSWMGWRIEFFFTTDSGIKYHAAILENSKLKKEYEFNNNFKYDFVIRSRFDVKVNNFNINKNYLYLINDDDNFCDLFFAGKSHIIDIISECYLWFVKQNPNYLITFKNGEAILRYYVDQLDLNMPFLNNFDITFNKDYPIEIKNIKNGVITPIYG